MTPSPEAARALEDIFEACHRPSLVDPDPLSVALSYPDAGDREVAGLFCACMALGRARSIVDACAAALAPFGPRPADALASMTGEEACAAVGRPAYRFFTRRDMAALLRACAVLRGRFGSLEAAFAAPPHRISVPPRRPYAGPSAALLARCDSFVDRLLESARAEASGPGPLAPNLLPAPRGGSACKRLMLFLRWMVRRDEVDPGPWTLVSPAELVVPLDVHVHRIARELGLTSRAAADLAAALEVTDALRSLDPADPVRFDFALARLGIRNDYHLKDYFCP